MAQDPRQVRGEVRRLLEASPAYLALPPDERRRLAHDMVKVGTFLADPGWMQSAEGLADPVEQLKGRLAQKPGQVGAEFKAGAVREGIKQFGELVRKVDFPE